MTISGSDDKTWGIDNEYDVLTDVLLGRPDYYRWTDAGALTQRTFDNADRLGVTFDLQLAQHQHRQMVDCYEDAGVACHYIRSDEHLHRNFFARDSNAMTPFGPIICHMQLKTRRPDYVTAIEFYQNAGIPIWNMVTAGHFEGGDFNIIEPGAVMVGYCGERSEEAGSRQVASWMEQQGWEALLVPIPAHFIHMDALVVMIAPKLAVACLDALEDWVIDWLKARGIEFVPVGYRECVQSLGVNLVSLGDSKILSMASSKDLNQRLRAMGFSVYDPDMSMFTLGGGGVHCLSQALHRKAG